MFCIVIPLYNKEQTIARTIHSILRQTVPDFEIIVVDDGSTDAGPQVVESIHDKRIRLIHQENQGVAAARNGGIMATQCDLVAFLDADDEWKPTFLETIRRLRQDHPEAAVFATSYLFDDDRHTWHPVHRGIPSPPWEGILEDYFAIAARSDPPLCSSAVAVKSSAIRAIGGFPRGVTSGEDLLTWARLAVAHQIAFSAERLSIFHLGGYCPPSGLRRQPPDRDVVGPELRRLLPLTRGPQNRSLCLYLGMWNKMRASILLRAGRRSAALNHALRAIAWNPWNWRYYALLLLSLCPSRGGRWLACRAVQVRQGIARAWRAHQEGAAHATVR